MIATVVSPSSDVPRTRRGFSPRAIVAAFALSSVASALAANSGSPSTTIRDARSTDEEVVALQNFVVTGSNIRRLDMEKIAPVTVLTAESIEARNALTPVDLLTALPQVIS